jgi:ion channel POLLUX/CASTOR
MKNYWNTDFLINLSIPKSLFLNMSQFKNFKNRTWYKIELYIGKGGASMFYALAIVLITTILLLLSIRYLMLWLVPDTTLPGGDFWNNFYHLFLEVTDPGTMANFLEMPFWIKFTAVLAGMCGIVIFSLLVAIITAAVEKMLHTFSQGTTDVYEKDHFLIIGNNSRLTDILNEFAIVSEYEKHTVVILSETPKEEIDNEIELSVKKLNKLKIVTRTGKITSPAMLEKVSVDTAQAIIVLSACENFSTYEEKESSDTNVIKICYALSIAINKGHRIMVIPEVYEEANREIIKNILHERVLQLDSNSFMSRLLVQTSLFNGLVGVYETLFSFEGSEIYFVKNTIGKIKFGEVSYHLKDGVAIGYKCPEKGLIINPSPDDELNETQRLIVIMTDISKYSYHSKKIQEPVALAYVRGKNNPVLTSILIIGWNTETAEVIAEYDKYITSNSTFKLVLTENCSPEEEELEELKKNINAKLEVEKIELLDEKYLKKLDLYSFDMMVVLTAFVNTNNTEAVDSVNIKLLLLVKKLLSDDTKKKPLIVAEVLDTSNLELFDHMGLSDFLLSNRLISIFLAQLSKQPELIEVYDRLLSKDGAEIYIKPIANYLAKTGDEYTFADLLLLGQQCKEIVIGYKKMLAVPKENGRNYDIVLNPPKNEKIRLTDQDYLVVISDES